MGAALSVNPDDWTCAGNGRYVEGVVTTEPEPVPTRCCLPQFDPFPEVRLGEGHEATHIYPIMKERQISKSDRLDRDRSQVNMESNMMWKVRSNGLPYEFAVPPWETLIPHLSETRSYQFQVYEAIREHMGTAGEAILRMTDKHPKKNVASIHEMLTMFFKTTENQGRGFPMPKSSSHAWTSDEEFCRCRLSGTHPCALKVVTRKSQLPSGFEYKDDFFIGMMETYDTLEEALNAGRIFMVDYSEVLHVDTDDVAKMNMDPEEIENLKHKSKFSSNEFICNPVALFFKTKEDVIQPLGIQLWGKANYKFLEKNPINPVFTPCDNYYAWTLAKMYFNCADMHVHLLISLCTYVILFAAVIQLYLVRGLSMNHPLRQLLHPHLKMSNAHFKRMVDSLINENGPLASFLRFDCKAIKSLMADQWRKFDFNNRSFKNDTFGRFDGPVKGNAFVEHGQLWWNYLQDYTKDLLLKYYAGSDDIDDDTELKSWMHEMANNITRVMELHPARREEPITFNVVSIIFTVTAQYAALTHSMYDHYSNVAAFPGNIPITETIRKNRNHITLSDVVALLPDKRSALIQIATAYVLSGKNDPVNKSTVFGYGIAEDGFKDKRIHATISKWFKEKLENLKAAMDNANKDSLYEYTCLYPANVRNNPAVVTT